MCGMLKLQEGPYVIEHNPNHPKKLRYLVRVPGLEFLSVDCLDLRETKDIIGFGSTKMKAVREALYAKDVLCSLRNI